MNDIDTKTIQDYGKRLERLESQETPLSTGSSSDINATVRFSLNSIPWIETGTALPGSPVNTQQFYLAQSSGRRVLVEYLTSEFSGPSAAWYVVGRGVVDSFDRANSATHPGAPEMALTAWYPVVGTWGISSNQLYSATNTALDLVVTEAGVSEKTMQVVVSGDLNGATYSAPFIVPYYLDANNFIYVQLFGGNVSLQKKDGGAFSTLPGTTTPQTTTDGVAYTVCIICNATTITVYVDGVLRITYPMSTAEYKFLQATKIGFFFDKSGSPVNNARWDSLKIRQQTS